MPLSLAQQRALAFAPRVTGSMSMFGSSCIIRSTIREIQDGTAGTYHRLLLGLSIMDFISSFANALSTLPIPKGTPGVWGPAGNTATCIAQGFFVQFLHAVPLYSGSLSIYYLLVTRYGWNQDRLRKVEPLMHFFPLLLGIGGAVASIPLKLMNNANLWCWIAPFPQGCKDSYRYGDDGDCERGDNYWIYRLAFCYVPVWVCIGVSMVAMFLVYWTVLQQEKNLDRYQCDGGCPRTQSKAVAWQAFWYIAAFYISWLPGSALRILQAIPMTRARNYYPILLSMAVLLPMQGFLNFFVYFRAKYLLYRREHPDAKFCESIVKAAFGSPKKFRPDQLEMSVKSFASMKSFASKLSIYS